MLLGYLLFVPIHRKTLFLANMLVCLVWIIQNCYFCRALLCGSLEGGGRILVSTRGFFRTLLRLIQVYPVPKIIVAASWSVLPAKPQAIQENSFCGLLYCLLTCGVLGLDYGEDHPPLFKTDLMVGAMFLSGSSSEIDAGLTWHKDSWYKSTTE